MLNPDAIGEAALIEASRWQRAAFPVFNIKEDDVPEVWMHIAFAPRDGRTIRVKSDEGSTHKARFVAPHWWECGRGFLRMADAVLYNGEQDIMHAEQFDGGTYD